MSRFCQSMNAFLDSGISVSEALSIQNTLDSRKSDAYKKLSEAVMAGKSLAESLRQFFRTPSIIVALIKIGEERGKLREVFGRCSEYLTKQQRIRQNIMGALLYPCLIFLAMNALMIVLASYVFPQLIPVFTSMGVSLPFSTRLILFLYNFFSTYWIYVILTISISAFLGIFVFKKYVRVRNLIQHILIKTPLISKIVKHYMLQRLFYLLSLLTESGVSVTNSFEHVVYHITFKPVHDVFHDIQMRMKAGLSLSECMKKHPYIFETALVSAVAVGEKTSTLPNAIKRISEEKERELDMVIQFCIKISEPAVMTALAIVVGFVAFSVIAPMYSLTPSLHG